MVLRWAAGETDEVRRVAADGAEAVRAESDEAEEESDTGTCCEVQRAWEEAADPLTQTDEREE